MKILFMTFFLLSSTALADDFDMLELSELPAGSRITFTKDVLIEAHKTEVWTGTCALRFESSEGHRQLTRAHTLVLKSLDTVKNDAFVDDEEDCQEVGSQWICAQVYRSVAYYIMNFQVKKNGSTTKSMIEMTCEDKTGTAHRSILGFKNHLGINGMNLEVNKKLIDF